MAEKCFEMNQVLLIVYIFLMSGATLWLHASHYVNFDSKINVSEVSQLAGAAKQARVVHILGEGCGCSKIVGNHLLSRGPRSGLQELVIVIGRMPQFEIQLKEKGFVVSSEPLEQFRVEHPMVLGVPMFLVQLSDQSIRYSGGYADRMVAPGVKIHDEKIIDGVLAGGTEKELPTLGCHISKKYQSLLDPIGIKYGVNL